MDIEDMSPDQIERDRVIDEAMKNIKNLDDLTAFAETEVFKNLPPPDFPSFYYNVDGEQIEIYKTEEPYYGKWIDHHLTLFLAQELPPEEYWRALGEQEKVSLPDSIIGYEIADIFGLFRRCFGRELTDKIRKVIEDHYKDKE